MALQKPSIRALTIGLSDWFTQTSIAPNEAATHRIGINADGQVSVNEVPVPQAKLSQTLAALTRETPRIQFDLYASTSYARVLDVLAIDRAGLTDRSFCFANLERYRDFDKDWVHKPLFLSLMDTEPHMSLPIADLPACDPPLDDPASQWPGLGAKS